jgi:uncharacterized protein (TIGR00369 family)
VSAAKKAKPALEPASQRESTGLEYLQRLAKGEIGNVPIGDTLGFRLVEAEKGHVILVGDPDERSFNLMGTLHGGWPAAILDTAMALSTLSSLDEHHHFTTVDIKINYLRPITRETGEVRAEGRLLHGGRRIALCEGRLLDPGGKLLCHGTSTCLIIPRSQTGGRST